MSVATPNTGAVAYHHYLGRFLLAVLIVQSVYWFVLQPIIGKIPSPPDLYPIQAMEVAKLASPDIEGIDSADFAPMERGWYGCCEPAWYVARATVGFSEPLPEAIAYLPRMNADNAVLYVNGHLAATDGSLDLNLEHPDIEQMRQAWFIPGALLVQGENRFDLVTVRSSMPYTDISSPWIAPYQAFKKNVKFREFMFREYYWISIAISLVLALLALTVFVRGGRQPSFIWICVLLLAWGGRLYLQLWSTYPFPINTRPPVALVLEALMALSWCNFANEWTRKPIRWLRLGSIGLWFATVVAILATQLLPSPDNYDYSGEVLHYAGLLLVAAAICRFCWHILRNRDERIGEVAVFTLLATFLGMDFYSEITTQLPNGNVRYSLPLVFAAFAIAFLSRNVHLFRSMNEFNLLLSTRLSEREKEIADSYAQRQEVNRQQALLEERKRIMRDMHDGMGGRLMSLAAQLRNTAGEGPSREELADDLLGTLDELRLIVDSLDTAGDDLGMAIGAFRARMEPKLLAAGIQSIWQIDDEAASTSLSAGNILHIYRIMQEVCSNMLRYSGATLFTVRLLKDEAGALVLEMSDNGCGLPADPQGGLGLANMRSRASSLGANLVVADNQPGVKVSLELAGSNMLA